MQKKNIHDLSRTRDSIEVSISFSADLRDLLHPVLRSCPTITRRPAHHTTIKDLIESMRIPHTEIGNLVVDGLEVDFTYRLKNGNVIHANSTSAGLNPCLADLLRPTPLQEIRFGVDINVAKLGRLLRMVGFDSLVLSYPDDAALAETAVREGRILLTRDRNILKRKIITHGHLVRNELPDQQLSEILSLYNLFDKISPFTRCMRCNTPLLPIKKEDISHRLEPLTQKYYSYFFHCLGCDNIYWSGSHRSAMEQTLAKVLGTAKRT